MPRVPLFGTRVLGSLPAPLFFLPLNLQLLTFKFRSPTVTFSAQNRSSTTEYYCLVVTDAREWAMLARGLVSLHSPPLLGQKPSLVKSRVSITSKLIESKRLQVLYFGHLRKTGGRGSYGHLTKDVHPEPAEGALLLLFHSGWPAQSNFDPIRLGPPLVLNIPYLTTSFSPFHPPPVAFITQYPAPIAPPPPTTEPTNIPAICGNPPCGYASFAYRCPNAHH